MKKIIKEIDMKLLDLYSNRKEIFIMYEYKGNIKSYVGRISKYDMVYCTIEIKRKRIALTNIICYKEI